MPPRHTYWTIILEGKPTAFRAHTREELEPTLRQLQARHPDAVLKWFARGRLWESPEQAREATTRRPSAGDRRGPGWRPGGSHQDPRERFKVPRDEKRRRFAERARRDRVEPRDNQPAGDGRRPDRPRPRGDRFQQPAPGSRTPGGPQERRPGWQPQRPAGIPTGPRPDRRREGEPGAPPDRRPAWKRDRPPGIPTGPRPERTGDRPEGPRGDQPRRREDRRDRQKHRGGTQGDRARPPWRPEPEKEKRDRERRPFRPPGPRGPSSERGGGRRPNGGGRRGGGGGGGRSR
jgi:hypothetical protein